MTDTDAELIPQLRARADDVLSGNYSTKHLLRSAADALEARNAEIERLTAENERLHFDYTRLADRRSNG